MVLNCLIWNENLATLQPQRFGEYLTTPRARVRPAPALPIIIIMEPATILSLQYTFGFHWSSPFSPLSSHQASRQVRARILSGGNYLPSPSEIGQKQAVLDGYFEMMSNAESFFNHQGKELVRLVLQVWYCMSKKSCPIFYSNLL